MKTGNIRNAQKRAAGVTFNHAIKKRFLSGHLKCCLLFYFLRLSVSWAFVMGAGYRWSCQVGPGGHWGRGTSSLLLTFRQTDLFSPEPRSLPSPQSLLRSEAAVIKTSRSDPVSLHFTGNCLHRSENMPCVKQMY